MEFLRFNDRQGKRIWILGGFLLLMAGGWNPPARGADEGSSSKSWRKGPVEYILTAKEEKEFKSLKTPEARVKFVEEFEQHMRVIARFTETTDQYIPYLIRKAEHIEDYLQS